jgi:hypothetical protein
MGRRYRSGADDGAAAFEEGDVAPAAVMAADALAGADDTEPGPLVEPEAGGVLGEDPGLNGPDPGGFGGADQASSRAAPMPQPCAPGRT